GGGVSEAGRRVIHQIRHQIVHQMHCIRGLVVYRRRGEYAMPAKHPDAIIIFTPGDGQAHMVGAHKQPQGWRYSAWTFLPEKRLNGFIDNLKRMGMVLVDAREAASQHTPGMGRATPILLANSVDGLDDAVEAYKQVLAAVLAGRHNE